MSYVGGDTGASHFRLTSPGDAGYAATNETGPEFVDLRVRKGNRLSIFRVAEHRDGTSCTFSWELISSG